MVAKNTLKKAQRFHMIVKLRVITFQFHFQLQMECKKVIALMTPEIEQPTCKNIIKMN